MRTRSEVSADKLRGGFYSPPALVKACLDRVKTLVGDRVDLRVIEPSAGDGAFVRGLSAHSLGSQVAHLTAVEPIPDEAAKCRKALDEAPFDGQCAIRSAIRGLDSHQADIAVGNPPYVRFQFLSPEDQAGVAALGAELGLRLGGVGNLWIPVLLEALNALAPGGAFAFIIPAECFTGVSALALRTWLLSKTEQLTVDVFEVGAFPAVLQEVIVLSGRMSDSTTPAGSLTINPHEPGIAPWTHTVDPAAKTWTRYLLTPQQVSAYVQARRTAGVMSVGDVARFTVGTVSGANAFFCVDDDTVAEYRLHAWARPLLPKLRYAPRPLFDERDFEAMREDGQRAWLLHFSADRPDPLWSPGSRRYLAMGEELGLPSRYKCRIRTPWYRVPVVQPGAVMLNKRSHLQPRMVLNGMQVLTTDTIYQANMKPGYERDAQALVFGFHSSMSLLSVEIEGRSFAGGVLELVPSEIARLAVPFDPRLGMELERLHLSRVTSVTAQEDLIDEVDRLVTKFMPDLDAAMYEDVRAARQSLLRLRLDRNGASSSKSSGLIDPMDDGI